MIEHEQVSITNPQTGRQVDVDEQIAPLIKRLWACNIKTTMSCQDIEGICWIEFYDETSFLKFITTTLNRCKYSIQINRAGNQRQFYRYSVRFDTNHLRKITKFFNPLVEDLTSQIVKLFKPGIVSKPFVILGSGVLKSLESRKILIQTYGPVTLTTPDEDADYLIEFDLLITDKTNGESERSVRLTEMRRSSI